MKQRAIPCMLMRGGTSKGPYFLASDLPADVPTRDAVLLAVMGSPDIRQIDGIGGADTLTSKVAIVSRSSRSDADIDYLFAQVAVGEARVDTSPNCGNMLAGVGPFAIERGLIAAADATTDVAIHMVNSGKTVIATVQTPDGKVTYDGDAQIDGVPGTAAAVPLAFRDIAGSACGALLPTGNAVDEIAGFTVTCIDNGMPVVVVPAAAFGKTGHETPADLEADPAFRADLERLRLAAGPLMTLGDVTEKVVPKMSLVAAPSGDGHLTTRTFIPHRCHAAIGVLGAVSVATACVLEGSVAHRIALPSADGTVHVEHPGGSFTVDLDIDRSDGFAVGRAALLRTARRLFDGEVYIPGHIWPDPALPDPATKVAA